MGGGGGGGGAGGGFWEQPGAKLNSKGGWEGEGMMADSWDDLNRQWSAGSSFLCAAGRPDVERPRSRAVVGREGREARQTPVRQRREEVPGAVLLRRTGKERAKWSRTAEGTSIQQPAAAARAEGSDQQWSCWLAQCGGSTTRLSFRPAGPRRQRSAAEEVGGGRGADGGCWWVVIVGCDVELWSGGCAVRDGESHSKRKGDRRERRGRG
jgi:hypothetical protein